MRKMHFGELAILQHTVLIGGQGRHRKRGRKEDNCTSSAQRQIMNICEQNISVFLQNLFCHFTVCPVTKTILPKEFLRSKGREVLFLGTSSFSETKGQGLFFSTKDFYFRETQEEERNEGRKVLHIPPPLFSMEKFDKIFPLPIFIRIFFAGREKKKRKISLSSFPHFPKISSSLSASGVRVQMSTNLL